MIVEDDVGLSRLISDILSDDGHSVQVFNDPCQAVAELGNEAFSLVITDVKMPGMDGIEVLDHVKRIDPHVPVIIITAHATVDVSIQALRKGADDLITKPFEAEEFLYRVRKTLRNNALLEENLKLKQELFSRFRFENIIGISDSIKQVLAKVEKVAQRDLPVLIIGESGTGKELVSQAIHYNSPRSENPFIAINCGALPQSLLEGELFGYRKGAFTGAAADKKGLITMADQGTLFLDEIGDMPLSLQAKILKVIETGEVSPIGETKSIHADIRLVAATNKNLEEQIQKGLFREDLYYRLNVIEVKIPSLRERKEDIDVLARHFVETYSEENNKKVVGITDEAMEVLLNYPWPGNIRELRNVIERAVVLSGSGKIDVSELPDRLKTVRSDKNVQTLKARLDYYEEKIIKDALQTHAWNKDEVARELDVDLATLYRKIKKLGIEK